MGKTLTEKILARAAGLPEVTAGQEIAARPDYVLAYDWPGQTDVIFREIREGFGIERLDGPERFAMFIDHMTSGENPKDLAFHARTRQSCKEYGIEVHEGLGIGHHVASELGYAAPGAFVVHFDGHISQLGAFGALAIGLRRSLIEAFVSPAVTMTVPHTVRVDFTGKLRPGVMARDVFHQLVDTLGPDSCRFQMVEFGGPGLRELSTDDLQTLGGLAMFLGALSAVVDYEEDDARLLQARRRARRDFGAVSSDADASYAAKHTLDLDTVEPLVVAPHTPRNVRRLQECAGLEVHRGYIGSCVSGRIEDIRAAARVLEGRRVKPGFVLNVVPTSAAILQAAEAEGLVAILAAAGANIPRSTCDYCYGRAGTMDAGQRAVSTGTLNVQGRMGHVDSEIYLCSAATIAASAIEGRIADPRKYLEGRP